MFILFIIAGMILTFGIILLIIRIQYIRKGVISEATVVNFHIIERTNTDDSDRLYIKFKYYTLENEEIILEFDDWGTYGEWQIGDKETIVYQTYNPQRVVFLNYWDSFGIVTILFSVALVLILIAAGYYWSQHFFNSL